MKKTYKLEHPKIKVARIVDSIRHDIKKFLKKERNKPLPSNANYWGFNCKCGRTEETAVDVSLSTLTKSIDELVEKNVTTIYIELVATPILKPDSPSEEAY